MPDISEAELAALVARGRVLQAKLGMPSVIEHDGNVTKIWTRRPRPSSDWFRPYAHRFRRNAARLRACGVNAPDVVAHGRVTGTNRRYVTYRHIPGEALRTAAFDVSAFAEFVATLHSKGIYFRSLHLGNVLASDEGFALIDVTDAAFRAGALPLSLRARNLTFLASYADDAARLEPVAGFFAAYASASGLSAGDVEALESAFMRSLASWTRG